MTNISDVQRSRIREQFPALESKTVFFENAGGSQIPRAVADRVRDYMLHSYVQLGAGYPLSRECTKVVEDAHAFVQTVVNGGHGSVILGSSSTSLLHMLAKCYSDILEPGDEIVIAETGHEANVGPWVDLETKGIRIRWWRVDPETMTCPIDELDSVLGERTRIVALPQVSNLLGEVVDLAEVSKRAHAVGAEVVADGVAFAPHRPMDVAAWDVDWYAYSTYKVYGPHMAALWGRRESIEKLTGPNHFFVPRDEVPYKFELGGASHEGCAAILGLGEYLSFLAELAGNEGGSNGSVEQPATLNRAAIVDAFELMAACELPLQERLISYLLEHSAVKVIGPNSHGSERVPTISFIHRSKSSAEITSRFDRSDIAIRHGHMYAYRLCERLGIEVEDGVVRISLVHYNTPEEVERVIALLEEIL